MFAPLLAGRCRERVIALSISLLVHAIFLGWLLHSPAPTFLTPSFLVKGENGKYIAHLYWPGKDSFRHILQGQESNGQGTSNLESSERC